MAWADDMVSGSGGETCLGQALGWGRRRGGRGGKEGVAVILGRVKHLHSVFAFFGVKGLAFGIWRALFSF